MTTLNTTTLAKVQLQQVIEQLEKLLFCDLVTTYNSYASANYFELIHDNDEENINTLFDTPYDTAKAIVHGKYNPNDDYVMLDGYANAVSFSYQLVQDENCPIDIEELAQWIVDNELYNDYDIEVTTLEDMLASIEDNITDDENMLSKLVSHLRLSLYSEDEVLDDGNDWDEYRIEQCMDWLKTSYDYNQLNDIITHLNINYE